MRELGTLPNKHGYEFAGVLKDDTFLLCIVKKDEKGLHSTYDAKTNRKCYHSLKGWRELL